METIARLHHDRCRGPIGIDVVVVVVAIAGVAAATIHWPCPLACATNLCKSLRLLICALASRRAS